MHGLKSFQQMPSLGRATRLLICTTRCNLPVSRETDGLQDDIVLDNTLIDMYAKCGNLEEAQCMLNKLPNTSVVSWNAMITGYAQHELGNRALGFFGRMQEIGIEPNRVTLLSILKSCGYIEAIKEGRLIHSSIIKDGMDYDVIIGNAIVNMYAKCMSLTETYNMFQILPNRDVVSWGAMIAGYAQNRGALPALDFFQDMQEEGIKPNKVIFLNMLKICGNEGKIEWGRFCHSHVILCQLTKDVVIGSTLVHMYTKYGSLNEARRAFDVLPRHDIVLWNIMISAYSQHEDATSALIFYDNMCEEGIIPDKFTFVSLLKACGNRGIAQGRIVHEQIIETGQKLDLMVGNTLVDMYCKCGSLEDAQKVFDNLPNKDIVSWGAMIAGYAQHGEGLFALGLFEKLQGQGIKPNEIIFSSILKACGSTRAMDRGIWIHEQVIKFGLECDTVMGNSLVDMYAKCGNLKEARKVFGSLSHQDVVTWGAMIAGSAQHEEGLDAIEFFEGMQQTRIKPNEVIFSSLLKACGSVGAMEKGRLIHDQIIKDGLHLDIVVGNALVDMYCKCGCLEEACKVFLNMTKQDSVSWNVMIAGYSQNGHALPALELYEKIQQEGMKPDKMTFLATMKACGAIGALEQSRIVHEQFMECKFPIDVVIGSMLVDVYSKCGSLEEARKVFDKLRDQNVVSWSAMISGCAQNGNIILARECFEEMQQKGIKPDESTFTSILMACSHAGLVREGCQYFKSMMEDHEIMPDMQHHTCMIDLLGRAGFLYEAEYLLHSTDKPNLFGWTTLLGSCRRHSDVQLGRWSFDKVVDLDPSCAGSYILMSNIYADAHMADDAMELQKDKKPAVIRAVGRRGSLDLYCEEKDGERLLARI